MADGLNQVTLIGNLGADPELRFTQGGQAVLNMRIACTESWFDADAKERKERTEWVNVVVWGKRGEGLSKIVGKGSRVAVTGGLRTSEYEDREGQKRYKTEVHAREVILCDKAPGNGDRRQDDDRRDDRRERRPAASSSQRPW